MNGHISPAPEPPADPAQVRRRSTTDVVRAAVRGVGQTLITAGLVLLLFVVYEVFVSNVSADVAQHTVAKQYTHEVAQGHDPLRAQDRLELPAGKQQILPIGKGFANLYIPRLGKDYAETIIEGTRESDLLKGPGHYQKPYTAIPGQIGNFSIAGHRVGKGEPFLHLDLLRPGDAVVVQTATNWYVYRVLGNVATGNLASADSQGVVGREIVQPSRTEVIAPVPGHPGRTPTRALMTMTTCTPKYTAEKRMIVHALLARAVTVHAGQRPRELGGHQ